jgi:predicted PurR-regulated permease PerM
MSPAESAALAAIAPAEAAPLPPTAEAADCPWSRDERDATIFWSVAMTAALAFVFLVLRAIPSVGWPLLMAAFGAYLFDPVVGALVRRGLSRGLSAGLVVGVLVALTAGVVALAAPLALAQAMRLPTYVGDLFTWAQPRLEAALAQELPETLEQLLVLARTHAEQIASPAAAFAGRLVGGSLSLLSAALGVLLVPVVNFYLLRAWPRLLAVVDDLVPERQREVVRGRMRQVDRMLGGFIRGQLTMAAVLTVLYASVMSAIGLNLALVVGLATGFGNLVPYVGTATGLVLAAGFCLVDFGVDYHLALVVGTFVSLVALDSVFITPRIVGDRVGLSPAAVIVAVLACGSLFGFAGVLLAVPSAALLNQIAGAVIDVYRRSAWYRAG